MKGGCDTTLRTPCAAARAVNLLSPNNLWRHPTGEAFRTGVIFPLPRRLAGLLMAIYGQPNSWTCGPFALKHGLLALGVFAREDALASAAGSTEQHGTDEPGLRRAARLHGAELGVERWTNPRAARRAVVAWLDRWVPVLLCLDQWEHWVTAVAADAEHVILFDSKYDAPLRAEPWAPLLERLACRRHYLGGVWTSTLYDLHPLLPRRAPALRLTLSPERARQLMRDENAELAASWDDYARALLPLALSPGDQLELGEDLERFIASRRGAIADRVVAACGGGGETHAAAGRVVDGLRFVAGMYRALLLPEREAAAVARLAEIAVALLPAKPREALAVAAASAA